jgi:hypothetical protein
MQNTILSPFYDNLFSAAELAIKALLLVAYDYSPSFGIKASHQGIQTRYTQFANAGNVLPEYTTLFNKLSGFRTPAR